MVSIRNLTIFILGLLLAACGNETDENNNKNTEEPSVSVEVKEIQPQRYKQYIKVVGSIKPFNEADLGSEEGGKIERFAKEKGDEVRKGQIIAELENDVLEANMNAAKASYELAKTGYERQEIVYNDSVTSEYQFLQSKYNFQQAEANYEQIKARYDQTLITAPFDGIIEEKFFEEGEVVPPGGAQPIVRLISQGKVKVEAGIPERYVDDINIGDSAMITIDNVTLEPVWGAVSYVGPAVNKNNRTFPIEIVIPNKGGKIKPNLIANVSIDNGSYENVFTIPEEVVIRSDSGYVAYTIKNGQAIAKSINILNRSQDMIAVSEGLSAGDSLVIVGFQNLVQGEQVKVEGRGNSR